MTELRVRAATDPDSLTDDEQRVYLWYVAQIFSYYEGLYHLFVKGHIAPDTWDPKVIFMQTLLTQPILDRCGGHELPHTATDFSIISRNAGTLVARSSRIRM